MITMMVIQERNLLADQEVSTTLRLAEVRALVPEIFLQDEQKHAQPSPLVDRVPLHGASR